MGVSGSVSFNYTHNSVVSVKGVTQDAVEEALIMNDANFSSVETEGELVTVYGEPSDLYAIKEAIDASFGEQITYAICENEYLANEYITLDGEEKVVFDRLVSMLEELDDVENVYHNVD